MYLVCRLAICCPPHYRRHPALARCIARQALLFLFCLMAREKKSGQSQRLLQTAYKYRLLRQKKMPHDLLRTL